MNFIKAATAATDNHSEMAVLIKTKNLTDADSTDSKWSALRKLYAQAAGESAEVRALVTVANSIIYQGRVHFILTRKHVQDMMRADTNWAKADRRAFKNSQWAFVLRLGYAGLFKQTHVVKVGVTQRTLYTVTDTEMLALLSSVDSAAQLVASMEFITSTDDAGTGSGTGSGTREGTREGTGLGTGNGDRVGDTDNQITNNQITRTQITKELGIQIPNEFISPISKESETPVLADVVTKASSTEANQAGDSLLGQGSTEASKPAMSEWDELCGRAYALNRADAHTYEIVWKAVMDAFVPDDGEVLQWSFPNPEMPPELVAFAVNEFRMCMGDEIEFSTIDVAKGRAKAIKSSSRIAVESPVMPSPVPTPSTPVKIQPEPIVSVSEAISVPTSKPHNRIVIVPVSV